MVSTMKKAIGIAIGLLVLLIGLAGFISFWNSESTLAEVRERGANAPIGSLAARPTQAD